MKKFDKNKQLTRTTQNSSQLIKIWGKGAIAN
ncbi:MAG: hypothetical protein MRECE_9c039 [Mycoplasmataceae bacterium CE_OT135]|nr:MAG: hypothetical protein MRECE_44c006 [Mycoplasmataceae bacterium CE_OT135]KLL03780.1 MAG: hypothetical protein MRECE_9c039 [Mycoplasmataceae bacterium CE_OT135]